MDSDTPNQRLRVARERAGYRSAADAARRFRWNEATYYAHENGSRGLRPPMALRYGQAFRVSPEWLLYGGEGKPIASDVGGVLTLPISGEVAAGVWREREDWDEAKYEPIPYVEGRYPGIPVKALKITGTSVDALGIRSGDTVITVPYWTVRTEPQEGDIVIVERADGALVETTCKQVAIRRGVVELWPRSSDPRHRTPLSLRRNASPDGETQVEIVGLVVAVQHEFRYPMAVPRSGSNRLPPPMARLPAPPKN